jgi:hypothetical protein
MEPTAASEVIALVSALGPTGAIAVLWFLTARTARASESDTTRRLLLLEAIQVNTERTKDGVLALLERGK